LRILYLGTTLEWAISFGGGDGQPPDFVFDDVAFHPVLKSVGWEPTGSSNGNALVELLSELMQQYRWYQHRLVASHPDPLVKYEYTSTIGKPEKFEGYFIDVVSLQAAPSGVPVKFLVSFPKMHEGLVQCPLKKVLAESPPQIVVSYDPQQEGGMVASEALVIAKEATAQMSSAVECPPWSGDNVYLGLYIKHAEGEIKKKLEAEATQYVLRRQQLAAFLSHFGTALLEYDLEHFRSIHLLFEVQAFYAVVAISLPDGFPQLQPTIAIHSLYRPIKSRAPFVKTFNHVGDFPYSPRWSADEIAERTRTFLQETLPKFQVEECRA
jgi:BRCA1-A complex subunit BRE